MNDVSSLRHVVLSYAKEGNNRALHEIAATRGGIPLQTRQEICEILEERRLKGKSSTRQNAD